MGGKTSKPAPPPQLKQIFPNITTPVRPVVSPIAIGETCAVKQVRLNQVQSDLAVRQREVDSCDPQAAQARRTNAALAAEREWTNNKRNALAQAVAEFQKQIGITNNLAASNTPLKEYLDTLEQKAGTLEKKKLKLEHDERKQRRAFLDNDPQGGVPGPLGLETSDDKIMIAFWICYGAAIFAASLIGTRIFADRIGDTAAQLKLSAVITAFAYVIAYYAIVKLA